MASKKHHYVPAFYLAGFSDQTRGRDSQIYVYDRDTGMVRRGTAGGEACVSHLYRISHPQPNVVEEKLADFEEKVAVVIARLRSTDADPTPEAVNILFNFVAIQAMRVPQRRDWFADARKRVSELVLSGAAAVGPDVHLRSFSVDGSRRAVVSRAEAERVLATAEDPTVLTMDALHAAAGITPVLAERSWVIGRAPGGCHFICGDDPVTLDWAGEGPQPRGWEPGFASEEANVVMPLSSSEMLIGTYKRRRDARVDVTEHVVAKTNALTAVTARRWIYAARFPFRWELPVVGIMNGPSPLLRHARSAERR